MSLSVCQSCKKPFESSVSNRFYCLDCELRIFGSPAGPKPMKGPKGRSKHDVKKKILGMIGKLTEKEKEILKKRYPGYFDDL